MPFHESETVEHHSLDSIDVGEVVLPRLGDGTIDASAMPSASKAPATIPRWPIEMLDPSMKSAEVGTAEVFPEITRILWFDNWGRRWTPAKGGLSVHHAKYEVIWEVRAAIVCIVLVVDGRFWKTALELPPLP